MATTAPSQVHADPSPKSPEGVLPTFVVVGGMKCGTSSLYHYLRLHPEVAMAAKKELAYFTEEGNWREGESWYRSWFSPEDRVRGEASPQYTCYPHFAGVPERMHALIPDALLIYVVRDPVERLISHYRHNVASGRESRSLTEALDEPDSMYLARSQYHRQLERYLDLYDRDQILVLDQADLRDRRRDTLRRVFAFLDVDPDVWDIRFHRQHHRTQRKRVYTPTGERLAATWPMRQVARLPEPIRWVVEDVVYWPVSRPVPRPTVTAALREQIGEQLAEDVSRWRALTGCPYTHWSI